MEITETMKYNVKYDVFVDIDGSIYWRDMYGNLNPKKQHINRKGYVFIILGRRGKKYNVHRIVAETFIPNPDNKPEVDHINRIRNDNRVENLRWVTRRENLQNRSSTHRKHVYTEPHSEFGRLFFEKYGILRGEDPLLYMVVGGGNTAMDSCRTAKRLGAERVFIAYRRSEAEMPARLEEVKHAKEEGIEFLTLHNPIEYIADEKGNVCQVRLQKMELGEPDASGRRSPVPIEGAIETIDIDMAIVAVGVSPNPLVPKSIEGLELGRKNTIAVNDDMQSSIPTIFAGGDIVRGGATVILAMGDGRRAAKAMDEKLKA